MATSLRYIFTAPYKGDPTEGFDFEVIAPFDKVELVQPDNGDLYPDAPADHVYVSVECQMHTQLTTPGEDGEVDQLAASQAALIATQMDKAASSLAERYEFLGVMQYGE